MKKYHPAFSTFGEFKRENEPVKIGLWRNKNSYLNRNILIKITFFIKILFFICFSETALGDSSFIYKSLYDASASLNRVKDAKVSILDKSLPIDTWQDYDNKDNINEFVSQLTDATVTPNWITIRSERNLLAIYTNFLANAEWGRLNFNTQEQSEYEQLISDLFDRKDNSLVPNASYSNYRALKRNYENLLEIWQQTAQQDRTQEQNHRLDDAKRKLDKDPDTTKNRALDRRLRVLSGYDYSSLGKRVSQQYGANLGGETVKLPISSLNPRLDLFFDDSLWHSFKISLDTTKIAVPYGFTPRLSPEWCCSPNGEGFGSTPQAILSFDLMTVDIERPWLDEDIMFGSGVSSWRIKPDFPQLSDGNIPTSEAQNPPLNFLVRTLIFARNIQIKANWPKSVLGALRASKHSENINVRFGPLAISGRFSGIGDSSILIPVPQKDGYIQIPSMQLIGVISTLMPVAPSPRTDLIWGAQLPDLHLDD